MRTELLKIIYPWAEKLKVAAKPRAWLKASFFYPCYLLICRLLWHRGYLYLHHVELPVTLRCSLRCKNCSSMIPHFSHPADYKIQDLLQYMDRLFDSVDRIQIFRILGGEPFLYPDLDLVIEKALSCPKIRSIDIVTNGTVLPSRDILSKYKNDPRLAIYISDYGTYSTQKQKIIDLCDEVGMRYILKTSKEKIWLDYGDLKCRERNNPSLIKQMRHCRMLCRSFLDGRLYFCPRASFGTKLGIPDYPAEYVDFKKESDKKTLRRQIFELNQRSWLTACNYCDSGTKLCISIPAAEQIKTEDRKDTGQ